jgi:hypothetical protein
MEGFEDTTIGKEKKIYFTKKARTEKIIFKHEAILNKNDVAVFLFLSVLEKA